MDQQQEKLCKILGTEVSRLPDQITALLQKGVIIKLHIGRWRARATLDMEDLGLSHAEQSELIDMGTKRLLPKNFISKLQSIETSARAYVNSRTISTIFGNFIPIDAYDQIRSDIEERKANYFAVRDEIINNYETIRKSLNAEYTRIAHDSYRRKRGLATEDERERLSTESVFVERFVERIVALFPTKAEIEASFKFEVYLSYVPLPSLLAGDEAIALVNLIANEGGIEEQEQEFMMSAAIQLRQRVYDTLEKVLGSIAKNNKLHPNSVKGLRTLCEQVGALNWMGDSEIESMISKIREAIATKVDENALGTTENTLKAIATIARSAIIDLGVEQRGSRIAGVSDIPTISEVRQARQVVGFELDDDFGAEMRQQRAI